MEKIMKMMAGMTNEERTAASKNLKKKGAYGMKNSVEALTSQYDLVICVANVSATMRTTQRLEWSISKGGWDNPWYVNEIPFHLADVPQMKNYVNCYDAQRSSVRAFVEKCEGVTPFTGISPVDAFCGMMDTRF